MYEYKTKVLTRGGPEEWNVFANNEREARRITEAKSGFPKKEWKGLVVEKINRII